MKYLSKYYYLDRYEFTSRNQHGARFKKKAAKQIRSLEISCKRDNASDLEDLIVLGHMLNVPVHYSFKEGKAFIELMSRDAIRGAL